MTGTPTTLTKDDVWLIRHPACDRLFRAIRIRNRNGHRPSKGDVIRDVYGWDVSKGTRDSGYERIEMLISRGYVVNESDKGAARLKAVVTK